MADAISYTLRLRPDAKLVASLFGWPRLETDSEARELPLLSEVDTATLHQLVVGVSTTTLASSSDDSSLPALLERDGWIARTLEVRGVPFATVEPIRTASPLDVNRAGQGMRVSCLSRFALLRRDRARTTLISSRSRFQVVIHAPEVGFVVTQLALGADPQPSAIGSQQFDAIVSLLNLAEMLADDSEELTRPFVDWTAIDRQFHDQTRRGRMIDGYGGTYRLRGIVEPPSREPVQEVQLGLTRPDLEKLTKDDAPFQAVVERRSSHRQYDDANPVTVSQLSELLFRVARARKVSDVHGGGRVYPSGGAIYELAVHIVVRLCVGLEPGIYQYLPDSHALGIVAPTSSAAGALLGDARQSMGAVSRPQVLLVTSARFSEIAWKYESIPYALVLKHVGVLLAHLNLATTAMGLAGCALGGGNSEAFAVATGLDPFCQPSVGEFALGSRRGEL